MTDVRIAVVGAGGRMGGRVLARLPNHDGVCLGAALDRAAPVIDHELLGAAAISTADAAQAFANSDVAIDFTAPAACSALLPECIERGVAYVLASTGMTGADEKAVDDAAKKIPIVVASNFSVGVNLLFDLVERAARSLGSGFDVEINEIHHRHKRDAPSGTALSLGAAVQAGRGDMQERLGRAGSEPPRDDSQLGYAALRGGDVAGEHTVFFFGDGERVELTHRATTPDIFADGAIRAARWAAGKAPGRYSMQNVLAD